MRTFHTSSLVFAATILFADQAASEVLKREPPMGELREGQVVLVDDGSCPTGQIKQVTGGNHVAVGGFKHILRKRKCIPK